MRVEEERRGGGGRVDTQKRGRQGESEGGEEGEREGGEEEGREGGGGGDDWRLNVDAGSSGSEVLRSNFEHRKRGGKVIQALVEGF